MRRVVITGIGIISSIGDDATEVAASLRAGIAATPDQAANREGIHWVTEMKVALSAA